MNSTADRAVETYLKRLDADLDGLPRARRREILDEIAEHIAEARAELPAESEAETRTVLDRLGDPADIAAEARQRFDVVPVRPGWVETAALILLLFGGFIFGVGWFVGLVLLWSSAVWKPWEKLLGTLIIPGGLASVVFIFSIWAAGADSGASPCRIGPGEPPCSSGDSHVLAIVAFICLLVAPVIVTAYLAHRVLPQKELATA